MGRQRSMSLMKEKNKAPEKEFTKMKTRNLLYAKSKTLVIRMIKELRGRVDDLSKNFNKEIKTEMENIIRSQSEMKNTISEMKSTLERITNGMEQRILSATYRMG